VESFQQWGIDLIGRLSKTGNDNRRIIMAIDYSTEWTIVTEEAVAVGIFRTTAK
jgi:hypothetical protein